MKQFKVSDLKPMPGYILVEPAKADNKTASGIYLPTNDEKPQHGTVLACGSTVVIEGKEIKCPVKKGDMVLYKKWGGNDVKVDEIEYQFLKFDDVLATIN